MKKLDALRSKKGFTLIELLVALLITGILLATISSVFLMSQKIYVRSEAISNKEGSITNVETNLQKVLAVTTGVAISNTPQTALKESYSIGFKADGTCEEVIMTLIVDSAGNPVLDASGGKQYSRIDHAIPQISNITVRVTGSSETVTLNYGLIPIDTSMTTLSGGVVMNNIRQSNNNLPAFSQGALNGSAKQYLVLTLDDQV
ncbi:MAG: prepilin-type N-terminal cleavage/methylation domain-containing protein [Firmicutes bacterium]|nr:prepilin-type N-terminal cleavage/methylation domain-containing protein [Bacillota bacterium]